MSLRRIVVDNSAVIPAYFPEADNDDFDAGLVNNRARSLVQAIRIRNVSAYVPPSFFREFLNVSTRPLDQPGGWKINHVEEIRAQWEDLLSLPLIVVPHDEIVHHSGVLVFDDHCPAADARYVAAAIHTSADLWMSHEHRDGLAHIARKYIKKVGLLSIEAPSF